MQGNIEIVQFVNWTGDWLKWRWSTSLLHSRSVSKATWPLFRLRLQFTNQTIQKQTTSFSPAESPNCWTGKSPLRTEAIPLAQHGSSNNHTTLTRRFLISQIRGRSWWSTWIPTLVVVEESSLPFLCSGWSQSPRSSWMDTCTCKERYKHKHKIQHM